MRTIFKKLLCYWEVKQQRKKESELFLKTNQLKLVLKRDTSITLFCITPKLNTKTKKYDIVRDKDGYVVESNLTKNQATKRTGELSREAQKKYPKLNSEEALERYLDDVIKENLKQAKKSRIQQMKNTFVDANGSGKYSPHELESFADIEKLFKTSTRASKVNEAGDIIVLSGKLKGQSLDPLGLSERAIDSWRRRFDFLWDERRQFVNSIDRHFEKIHSPRNGKPPLDKVVLDFRHMDDVGNDMKKKVIDYIYNGIEVGGIKFPNQYKQYVNDNYFIKINF